MNQISSAIIGALSFPCHPYLRFPLRFSEKKIQEVLDPNSFVERARGISPAEDPGRPVPGAVNDPGPRRLLPRPTPVIVITEQPANPGPGPDQQPSRPPPSPDPYVPPLPHHAPSPPPSASQRIDPWARPSSPHRSPPLPVPWHRPSAPTCICAHPHCGTSPHPSADPFASSVRRRIRGFRVPLTHLEKT